MLVLVPYKLGLALYNYSTSAPGVCFPFFNGPPEIFIGQDARFDAKSANFNRRTARLSALALLLLSTSFAATAAMAGSNSSDANARYQAERAVCNSGQSSQDRVTCLKEAGAALAESRRGRLNDGQGAYNQNALIRCNALPVDDRDACRRRIEGEGTTNGSVATGGLLREIVTPDNK